MPAPRAANSPPAVLPSIWSAAPTPLTRDLRVDVESLQRMVDDAVAQRVDGLFLAGTCGEGPWLPDREKVRLMRTAVTTAAGRLAIAVQVTDTSVPRIKENATVAAGEGADFAVIAPPPLMPNATPERIAGLFVAAAESSPLPVGVYDLGRHRAVMIPEERLQEVYLAPQVQFVKDSSGSPERRAQALAAQRKKPSLRLFNGDEFRCLEYLQAGYDGLMFGGAVAVAPLMRRIVKLVSAGELEAAQKIDAAMKRVLFDIYGGESIACWLTGLKHYLVQRGLFATSESFLGYPLTEECRHQINRLVAEDTVHRLAQPS